MTETFATNETAAGCAWRSYGMTCAYRCVYVWWFAAFDRRCRLLLLLLILLRQSRNRIRILNGLSWIYFYSDENCWFGEMITWTFHIPIDNSVRFSSFSRQTIPIISYYISCSSLYTSTALTLKLFQNEKKSKKLKIKKKIIMIISCVLRLIYHHISPYSCLIAYRRGRKRARKRDMTDVWRSIR